ncbi:NAD-dependent DNA ligase LigA [Porphyromonas pogonae]|uniref:NAD-dependent DNA ligase LigA n=1 Tax=Porphyromonas pogonae TaxID=867595 RepID=UPI002E79BCD3|nr:NAD-dependent DNA ligase LigA [Porphyromonas pogonae]
MERIEERIRELRNEIDAHNYNYYVLSQPTIEDRDFDFLMKELQQLEAAHPELITPDSPTQRVGSDKTEGFSQIAHRYPMLSLSNTYNYDEVADFYHRVERELSGRNFDIIAELKFDGLSISLIYKHGILSHAVTRGDGQYGDDVTANVRTIRSIPLKLRGHDYPDDIEIRGEILLPFARFNALNKEREQNGEPLFANPRNAASGTLKQLDPSVVAKRQMDAYFYYVPGQPTLPDSHYERLMDCKHWGLKISDAIARCHSLQEVYAFLDYWDVARKNLPVATDGVVLKVDSIKEQEQLGYTAKSPRWAIAYKYQAEQARTKLVSVDYQVGRTGAITPVANLEPVLLSGTVVKRASLHNADFIRDKDLHIGDYVLVEKGGEIIPKIVGTDLTARTESTGEAVTFPTICPACGTPLVRQHGEAAYYCPDSVSCAPQQKGRIEHFCSRKAADINIGPETIDLLYKHHFVNNVSDLYDLTAPQLITLPGIQKKGASKLVASIEKSKDRPFHALLYGLGIRYVGETVAKTLTKAYSDIDSLRAATFEELITIPEIGPKIAESIRIYFDNYDNNHLVDQLLFKGLNFSRPVQEASTSNADTQVLAGKTVVISGVFRHHSRDEYKELVESLGGKMSSSISPKTDFILAGENMGPSKLEKAKQLGVEIKSEDDFRALIGEA